MVLFDNIAAIFGCLVLFIGLPCLAYNSRQIAHTNSDKKRLNYQMMGVLVLILLLAMTHHIVLFCLLWSALPWAVYTLLCSFQSRQSDYSAQYAFYSLLFGAFCVVFGLITLAIEHHIMLFDEIKGPEYGLLSSCALVVIVIGAAIQSALFPARRWLIQSLSAPTSVSALMHGGILNISGALLLRLSPAIQHSDIARFFLLLLAVSSICLGLLMSAVQTEQKRALACSTVAQMGVLFLFIGLNQPAVAAGHLVAHALFKAYSFLGMGFALYSPYPSQPPQPLLQQLYQSAMTLLIFVAIVLSMAPSADYYSLIELLLIGAFAAALGGLSHDITTALLITFLSSLIFIAWHKIFAGFFADSAILIPVYYQIVLVLPMLLISVIQHMPRSWQRRLYALTVRLSEPASQVIILQRSSLYVKEVPYDR